MKRLQLTLAILKPDLCMRPQAKEAVKAMIMKERFYVVRNAVVKLTPAKAREFYREHTDRFFFRRLVEFMCCHPLECLILAHPDAIQHWRALMGPTKPYIACNTAPRTIRGRFGLTDTRNSTHGSDSEASAEKEIGILFPEFSVGDWYKEQERHFRNGKLEFCTKEQTHKLRVENAG